MSPPVRRWNDQAVDGLAELVRSFAPTVGQVAALEAETEAAARDREELRRYIGDVEGRLTRLIEGVSDQCKATAERMDRLDQGRRQIVLGLLTFAGVVAAALIAATATLIAHFA